MLAFLLLVAAGVVTVVLPELGKEPEGDAERGASSAVKTDAPAETGQDTAAP